MNPDNKKREAIQLTIDFDNPVSDNEVGTGVMFISRADDYLSFPKKSGGTDLFETITVALDEINDCLVRYPKDLSTFIFEQYFVEGISIKEIEKYRNKVVGVRIPTRERIRQIAIGIANSLSSGERCAALKGVRLKDALCKDIAALKDPACGMFVYGNLLSDNHLRKLQGIASLLSMNVIEGRTVMPIMKNRLLLSDKVSVEVFWQHFRVLLQLMQEDVRPLSFDSLASGARDVLGNSYDERIAELILTEHTIFEKETSEEGVNTFMLKFVHLKIYQQFARIIYEKKSISVQDINTEMQLRGVDAVVLSLAQTRKKFSWCVPMGKTLWIYKEDGQGMDRIQDVIKDYCVKHVRFVYDDIVEYLHSLHFDMKDSSIRSYIMLYCRRLNADKNQFCLTSEVPEDEESLWYKKAEKCTRTRDKAYHKELIQMMVDAISNSDCGCILRKELRKQMVPFLEQQNVNVNNFYKILSASDRLEIVEMDGEAYVKLL